MRFIAAFFTLSLLLLTLVACGGGETPEASSDDSTATSDSSVADEVDLATEDEKILYVLGFGMAQQLGPLNLTPDELVAVKAGFTDASLKREARIEPNEYQAKIQAFGQERMAAAATAEAQASVAFLERMAAEPGAELLPSGLVFTELVAGSGDKPSATSKIKAHYHGTLRDGRVFDSSVDRGLPVDFALNQVVPCWGEGLQRIAVGGKAKLVCPPDMAYGVQGRPPQIPGNSALVFEVELIEILEP
jgi:FKBP-type peptidyl-prolyl cis-trans isomerase